MTVDMQRNNLDRSSSPYLRQHRDNPVYWQEWSTETLAAAADRKKPLFVSVGYSTCHWCHVMAAEAFSDAETARLLNENFICIKVDRETRPDIDQVLMRFAQEQNGGGGWPLNVFLTPDLRPVLALTYAPGRPRPGMASLQLIAERVLEYLREYPLDLPCLRFHEEMPTPAAPGQIADGLLARFDSQHGGFGSAAKFPPHSTLLYMLYALCVEPHAALERVCRLTLERMRRGGLHDHLQGGIFRYSVDRAWTIPHFEKMLYDQALALWWSALACRVLDDEASGKMAAGVLRCLEQTFAMDALFATAFDADTNHHEGLTYIWKYDEIKTVLTKEEFARLAESYRLPEKGNFEGAIHLTRKNDEPLPEIEAKLLAHRRQRPQPDRDEKILCGINALVACAYTQAARFLHRPELEKKAACTVKKLLDTFWDGTTLGHSLAAGAVQRQGFLSDAATLLLAVTMLREADEGWTLILRDLAGYVSSFRRNGRWIEADAADFQVVEASWFDHPTPAPVSLAKLALARVAVLQGRAPEESPWLPPHQADFHNIAALFSQGFFHQIHSPQAMAWSRLPANSIQVRDGNESDCYRGACRPLAF
jgi:uncharacterized protein YyaL (SSP411 family)